MRPSKPKLVSLHQQVLDKINNKISDLDVSKWSKELHNDIDKNYLLDGIQYGFSIVDREVVVKNVETNNHASCRTGTNKHRIEQMLRLEISNGRYVPVNTKPDICSPLAAIDKPDGSLRIIQNASIPNDLSLNDYSDKKVTVKYQTVKDALDMIVPGSFCCKIDLKSAYRSVGIRPSQYHMAGLQWKFAGDHEVTYMVDTRLMMGTSKAPSIFHRLSQAVKRCMEKRGYNVVAYLDDFLIVADDYVTCLNGQHALLKLLRELGFSIAWKKVEGPTRKLTFLGIAIDTVNMTVGLPDSKVAELVQVLQEFRTKKRASLKQLQSLAGRLNWACNVIKCGRSYLHNILHTMSSLRLPNHKARLSKTVFDDIEWWITILNTFPGKQVFHKPSINVVQFDACNTGSGFTYQGDWGYIDWECDIPELTNLHINCKETISAVLAARRWAPMWRDSRVMFMTDSIVARSCIAKGTSKNPLLLPWVRELHIYSVLYNFDIDACWLPGVENQIPDAISRLRLPHLRRWFMSVLGIDNHLEVNCINRLLCHVSKASLNFIFARSSGDAEIIG